MTFKDVYVTGNIHYIIAAPAGSGARAVGLKSRGVPPTSYDRHPRSLQELLCVVFAMPSISREHEVSSRGGLRLLSLQPDCSASANPKYQYGTRFYVRAD